MTTEMPVVECGIIYGWREEAMCMGSDRGCQLFGAYRCAASIKDAAILVHSTVGCNWGALLFHATSRLQDVRQTSSVIYEDDIVMGGEANFNIAISHMLNEYKSKLIIVLTGCVPELIGFPGEELIKARQNERIILLSTPGFCGGMKEGLAYAMKKLIGNMQQQPVIPNSVNLIGFFADDYQVDGDLNEILKLIPNGAQVNTIFPLDTWENIQKVPSAALNIVMEDFEYVGEELKKQFAMPYVTVRYPYGIEGSTQFYTTICDKLNITQSKGYLLEQAQIAYQQLEQIDSYINQLKQLPAAVFGQGSRILGLKNMLEQELGMPVTCLMDAETEEPEFTDLQNKNIAILFGNSFHKDVARQKNIPFFRMFYPVFDKVNITRRGYAGFQGMVNFIEELINVIFFNT